MRNALLALTVAVHLAVAGAGTARAGEPPSAEEAQKVTDALRVLGCIVGAIQKESGESAVRFQIDDAKCADGTYRVELDRDFKLASKTPE